MTQTSMSAGSGALDASALFGSDSDMIEAGSRYLAIAGPAFGFFGLGMALYFAGQGAARLGRPLAVTMLRTAIAVGDALVVASAGGTLWLVFAAVATGLIVYGLAMAVATASADWRPREAVRTG